MQSDYFTYFASSINPALKDPASEDPNNQLHIDHHSLASESHKFECPPIKYCDFKGPIKSRNNMKFRQLFGLTSRVAQTNDSTQQQSKGKKKNPFYIFKKNRQNAMILVKMRILSYDLTNFKKLVKSRHDIVE